ncbi:MAG: hypothetical protein IPQ24_00505 [Anaeromyxobacter sp.]|nr:hypothetical protein [Anaeromyxobacter sp.]
MRSKSPWYRSVIFGGMSPLPIRETHSTTMRVGLSTAAMVSLMPAMMGRNSPSTAASSPRTPSCPACTASRSLPASPTSAVTVLPIFLPRKTPMARSSTAARRIETTMVVSAREPAASPSSPFLAASVLVFSCTASMATAAFR